MTKDPCPHLERLLRPVNDGILPRVTNESAANATVDMISVMHPTFDLEKVQSLIRNYGFTDEWDLDLLTARYFYGMSYKRLAEEFNYVSKMTLHKRLKKLHKLLIERGFAQELE